MVAVSSISAMKVEMPLSWLSPAPTRARMQSKIGTCASSAGTKEPTCAIRAMQPICGGSLVRWSVCDRKRYAASHLSQIDTFSACVSSSDDLEFTVILLHLDVIRNEINVR